MSRPAGARWVPGAGDLEALGPDDWAQVLPLCRRALRELEPADGEEADVARLRELPPGRLVSGRDRARLCELVTADGARRDHLAGLLAAEPSLTPVLNALHLRAEGPPATGPGAAGAPAGSRDQARLRRLREQRDRARRQLAGAEARARRAEDEVAAASRRAEELAGRLSEAQRALGRADEDRRRAVERERRRGEAAAGDLRDQVRELREQLRAHREELDRLRRPPAPAPGGGDAPERADRTAGPPTGPVDDDRVRPGRPTRLPDTVARETAEGVDLLLSPGRLVLVDGYNVTKQHRPAADLAGQRDWLVRRLATLAAQRRVRPVAVFDGERASGARPAAAREVEVRFTPAGVTADDELVFAVEALPPDEPVLVVTDDRELTARLRALGADVVGTGPFVWATPS